MDGYGGFQILRPRGSGDAIHKVGGDKVKPIYVPNGIYIYCYELEKAARVQCPNNRRASFCSGGSGIFKRLAA